MGLWSFIKDAGAQLGIGSAHAAPPPEELQKEVEKHGLEVKDLDVKVEGDKVKVGGEVTDQATREKVVLALGNVRGVAAVEDEIKPAQAAPEAKMHTVKKGDTLWAIAEAQYGDGNKFKTIFEANRPMLKDPDEIYPGQVLRIPPLS
jgi:nucleoid-associated protein YgaU